MEHEALDVLTQKNPSLPKEALKATANQHDQHTSHKKKNRGNSIIDTNMSRELPCKSNPHGSLATDTPSNGGSSINVNLLGIPAHVTSSSIFSDTVTHNVTGARTSL